VTAILLEELACLGVQIVIGFGAAGSLESPRHIGKALVADRALCSDGTSRAYTDAPSVGPDADLLRLALEIASREGARPLVGTIHTTDALYQERPSRVRGWREAGASFVNLETAPFYAVSAYLNVRAVYLGLVTDYVGRLDRWQHGFWGRENTTDPQIVGLIHRILETAELP
jgi:purine-nucleoside phosphorylase